VLIYTYLILGAATEAWVYIESEAHPDNQIVVPDVLVDPLPLVEKTTKSLRAAGAVDHGMVKPRAKHCLDVR